MGFFYTFEGDTRAQLLAANKKHEENPQVPYAALAFVHDAVTKYPDGTRLKVTAEGIAPSLCTIKGTPLSATMTINITPL